MKRLFVSLTITIFLLLFNLNPTADALLIDNLDGTVTQIRNDGSALMWLKDANTASTSGYCSILGNCNSAGGLMRWDQANTWIDYLNNNNYLNYNDWRLPDTNPVNGTNYNYSYLSYDGSTDVGYNISAPGSAYPGSTGSEMAYMFYTELVNLGYFDTSGSGSQPGWGLTNTGPYDNLMNYYYWSGTDYSDPFYALAFHFDFGAQNGYVKCCGHLYAWAVRPDVSAPIPEPGSLLLLGSGLFGLGAFRKKFMKK